MKVLLDHNMPRKLSKALVDHEVHTAREMGWDRLSNGHLLRAAQEDGFTVVLTGDRSIVHQQNNRLRVVALVVLSHTNWRILQHHVTAINDALTRSFPGSYDELRFWQNDPVRGDRIS